MYILRSIIKGNPTLYLVWFKLVRKRQKKSARLPKKGDDLFFTGFPRSGNTYFNYLLRFNFPSLIFASHLHTIASLKIAFRNNLKVVVIIRNPFDSIASLLSMRSKKGDTLPTDRVIGNNLLDYQRYYNFLIMNQDQILIILFEDMIKNKLRMMKKVMHFIGSDCNSISEKSIEKFDIVMRQAERNKDYRAGSFPNKTKSIFKEKLKYFITVNSHYNNCLRFFELIKSQI